MSERKYILRGSETCFYPGIRGGYGDTQNLSRYVEEPVFDRVDKRAVLSGVVIFDIQRHLSWDKKYYLFPSTYSMRIEGYYPKNWFERVLFGRPSQPTIDHFRCIADGLEGFAPNMANPRRDDDFDEYKNKEWMLLIDYDRRSHAKAVRGLDRIWIGVIQYTKEENLAIVTDQIVPYAAEVFNQLSPTHKISPEIVQKSVDLARKMDGIAPRRRLASL